MKESECMVPILNVGLVFSDILLPATEKEDRLRDRKVRIRSINCTNIGLFKVIILYVFAKFKSDILPTPLRGPSMN